MKEYMFYIRNASDAKKSILKARRLKQDLSTLLRDKDKRFNHNFTRLFTWLYESKCE